MLIVAVAAAAVAAKPECAAASAEKFCCAPNKPCTAPHIHHGTRVCATGTDCSAHCGAALTSHQQRKCADGQFARLIGHECHACPEDAAETAGSATTAIPETTSIEITGGTAAPNAEKETTTKKKVEITTTQNTGTTGKTTKKATDTTNAPATTRDWGVYCAENSAATEEECNHILGSCPNGFRLAMRNFRSYCVRRDSSDVNFHFTADTRNSPKHDDICAPAQSGYTTCTVDSQTANTDGGVPYCTSESSNLVDPEYDEITGYWTMSCTAYVDGNDDVGGGYDDEENSSGGLSDAEIGGIAGGAAAGVLLLGVAVYKLMPEKSIV